MRSKGDDSEALQAYVKLMTEHQWAIRGFIVSLMPGSPDVDDVLQETNLVLWQKWERFESGTNFIAWSSRIARYEVMHRRDRMKRDGWVTLSDELINVLAEVKPPDKSREKLLSALDACIAKLGEKQREIIRHRYTPGKSLEQYATERGPSAGSLRIALHRIRLTLKSCIENTLAGNTG